MLKQRKGFTLIELLIVIVIIGILAAIAIPKFGKSREKAFFKAMQSDLRNLQSQQELYFSLPANNYQYSNAVANWPAGDITVSQGATVAVVAGTNQGWAATSAHAALAATQYCAVFVGTAAGYPSAVATTAGIVFCTGDQ